MTTNSRARVALGFALTAASLTGGWIVLVAGTQPHELIVGAVAACAAALFLLHAKQCEPLHLHFRVADVAAGWRVPSYLAVDVWVITKVLVLHLLGIQRAGSYYRVWAFETSKQDPVQAARRVLATLYTTTTPNSVVVGVDYQQQRILVHQMERSALTATERELGAKAFPAIEAASHARTHQHGAPR